MTQHQPSSEPDYKAGAEPAPHPDSAPRANQPHRAAQSPAPGGGLYVGSVLVLGALLGALFLAAYELLALHPEHARELAWRVYGALLAGLALLCAQAVFVTIRLLRPLREATLEAARLRIALDNVAHHDPLTGALNRVALDQALERGLEGLRRYGAEFAGIFVEAEGFHAINEAQGYAVSDLVLQELSRLLRARIRKSDSVYRWRSGSFVILAPGINAEQGGLLGAKLCELAAGHAFSHGVRLRLALGVAPARADDTQEGFLGRLKKGAALVGEQAR